MSLESLDCVLTRKVFHGVSKRPGAGIKYLIGRTETGRTIMGDMDVACVGENYRLWGEWRLQKPYNGRPAETAFEFIQHTVIVEETANGVAQYLANYVDGLGPVKAKALVEAFGADTLTTLRANPERAAHVQGISPELAQSIKQHFDDNPAVDPAAYARLIDMFKGMKIPRRIINTLIKDFGSDAPDWVEAHPYALLAFPRLGWKTVDDFATTVVKYPPDGLDRHKAAIVEALTRHANNGHTFGFASEIETLAYPLINSRPSGAAYEAAHGEGLINCAVNPDDTQWFALSKLADAEETIATRLALIARGADPLPFTIPPDGLLSGQQEAARLIESHSVCIVTGPPGTGKTYTIGRALKAFVDNGVRSIQVVTPTGKAAKRAEEVIRQALPGSPIQCSTIHRALGPVPSEAETDVPKGSSKHGRGRDEFTFAHNESQPLDASVIVVDEASMLDVSLAASLFRATSQGSRLIIVGDENQLPSVGPGSVLRDLIAAGIPTATLTEIQRNSGRIVRACHDIKDGVCPEPARKVDLDSGENWIHLEMSDPEQIAERIVELHASAEKNGRYDPTWDMQVISPQHEKPGIGCNALNARLSDLLNKWKRHHNPSGDEEPGRRPDFVCGDKIVRTKNGLADQLMPYSGNGRPDWRWDGKDWGIAEIDVVNGDMGTVVDICKDDDNWHVVVDFRNPNRTCRLPYGNCHLTAAYAMTCHKAQGSGFPYVILPVHNSFYFDPRTQTGLWNREMIYTMFSRAEKLLVTVGEFSAIRAAVSRKTVHQRKTRLKSLMIRAKARKEDECQRNSEAAMTRSESKPKPLSYQPNEIPAGLFSGNAPIATEPDSFTFTITSPTVTCQTNAPDVTEPESAPNPIDNLITKALSNV